MSEACTYGNMSLNIVIDQIDKHFMVFGTNRPLMHVTIERIFSLS